MYIVCCALSLLVHHGVSEGWLWLGGRSLTGAAAIGRVSPAGVRNVTGSDDHLLQVADLSHRFHLLVHVRQRGQYVALDFALVGSAQDAEAAVFTPPSSPGVDGDLWVAMEKRGLRH